ncbi:hypothetical protein D3871_26180 [Noviherbaspirillum saxi]|uniref:Uncharacterized protein n=1 Tax=Noviherbaspirillum saxi TaxID=2320863 RepID=A0A3A3G241_9BURK|nr:hypothetical protein D3871_26180 [Noviherbaspirillum saxi]
MSLIVLDEATLGFRKLHCVIHRCGRMGAPAPLPRVDYALQYIGTLTCGYQQLIWHGLFPASARMTGKVCNTTNHQYPPMNACCNDMGIPSLHAGEGSCAACQKKY